MADLGVASANEAIQGLTGKSGYEGFEVLAAVADAHDFVSFEPTALVDFAMREGRTAELIEALRLLGGADRETL